MGNTTYVCLPPAPIPVSPSLFVALLAGCLVPCLAKLCAGFAAPTGDSICMLPASYQQSTCSPPVFSHTVGDLSLQELADADTKELVQQVQARMRGCPHPPAKPSPTCSPAVSTHCIILCSPFIARNLISHELRSIITPLLSLHLFVPSMLCLFWFSMLVLMPSTQKWKCPWPLALSGQLELFLIDNHHQSPPTGQQPLPPTHCHCCFLMTELRFAFRSTTAISRHLTHTTFLFQSVLIATSFSSPLAGTLPGGKPGASPCGPLPATSPGKQTSFLQQEPVS